MKVESGKRKKSHTSNLLHKRAHIGRIFHMIELNSKQRKILEKAAHDLEPVVIIGGRGLSEGVVQMTDSQL